MNIGDIVVSRDHGRGKVISNSLEYPIRVSFDDGGEETFTNEGLYLRNEPRCDRSIRLDRSIADIVEVTSNRVLLKVSDHIIQILRDDIHVLSPSEITTKYDAVITFRGSNDKLKEMLFGEHYL